MTNDAITPATLLTQPPWNRATVLAGESALARGIAAVRLETHLGAVTAGAGALVVVVTEVATTDWRVDAALRRLADDGAVGLVLPGTQRLPRGTAALAERLSVVVLTSTEDPLELALATRQRLTAPETERAGYLLRSQTLLSRRTLTPDEITDTVSGLLETPVWTLTGEGTTLSGSSHAAPGFRPATLIVQRCPTQQGVTLLVPVSDSQGAHPELWIGAALATEDPHWEHTVREVLGSAALALRCWRAERRVELERDARARATVLADLMRLEAEPSAELQNRASELGWRLEGWHLGFYIGVPDDVDVLGATPELSTALRSTRPPGATAEIGVAMAVVEVPGGWSCWVTLEWEPTPTVVDRIVRGLRHVQRTHSPLVNSHVGVGRAHPGATGISATLGEASDAARLARNRKEVGRFLHIDRLGMAQLLLAWTRTDTFQPAARDLLAPLRARSAHLVSTLVAYLDCESNLTETAAVLGVHRNTVAARISRIEDLLGVDLTVPDERLALHLAARTVLAEE